MIPLGNIKGVKGDAGKGIASFERTSGNGSAGSTDTYTITYTDATTVSFNVYNGANGEVALADLSTAISGITKTSLGLANVDNTSDANKPVSTAQATAIANQMGSIITGLKETSVAMPANDINLSLGNLFTKTISGATTLTVSNIPASGTVGYFILKLTNGGAGAVTYPTGTKWSKGTAPTLTASGIDLLRFVTIDGGTRWEASRIQEDSK